MESISTLLFCTLRWSVLAEPTPALGQRTTVSMVETGSAVENFLLWEVSVQTQPFYDCAFFWTQGPLWGCSAGPHGSGSHAVCLDMEETSLAAPCTLIRGRRIKAEPNLTAHSERQAAMGTESHASSSTGPAHWPTLWLTDGLQEWHLCHMRALYCLSWPFTKC